MGSSCPATRLWVQVMFTTPEKKEQKKKREEEKGSRRKISYPKLVKPDMSDLLVLAVVLLLELHFRSKMAIHVFVLTEIGLPEYHLDWTDSNIHQWLTGTPNTKIS